jgi:DNA-binding response OmpR family regulator
MKILVVEDEHRLAEAIKRGLQQEKYIVDLAFDGQTGYEMALTDEYGLLVLDLMLPQMNGLDICRSLRSDGIHTPVLMLTARGRIEDKVEGFEAGADDYLAKPFAFVEFLARVKALSRRPQVTPQDKLQLADLTLDTATSQVSRGNKTLKLSKTEYALLEYLLRHQGKLLNKEQLINHVWSYEADILPNTVEVYVGYLRRKIDKDFPDSPPLLHTVRGFGYKLSTSNV